MRVFLDTNVLVSAVATRGLCADVFREILSSHQLVVSAPLISELNKILHSKIGIYQKNNIRFYRGIDPGLHFL